jgi:hypothetical protein
MADSACGHQALAFPPMDLVITGGPEEMAPNKDPLIMPPQNVSSRYGVAGYHGNHVIAGTQPAPVAAVSVAVTPMPAAQPAQGSGLARRADLVKHAMELGLKGSGTAAELAAAIAAREEWLALEAATKPESGV